MRITREKFIADIAGYVKKYAGLYGILVYSPVIAQAVLESGWGESRLASQYHNYFGLKCGTRWTGRSVNMRTQEEYREGTLTSIRDNFRVFDSMEEGVKPLPRGYAVQYSDEWCDTCVSATGIRAGCSELIGRECGVEEHVKIF